MSEVLGRDFDIGLVPITAGWKVAGRGYMLDLVPVAARSGRLRDLGLMEGRHNLAQSLVLRLLTMKGELAPLGRDSYGSKHHDLVGEPNTETNRNRLRLYVLDAVRQEPRVAEILELDIIVPEGAQGRDHVDIRLTVAVREEPTPLSLVVPFSFREAAE